MGSFDEKLEFFYLHTGDCHQGIGQRLIFLPDNYNASDFLCTVSFAKPPHVPQDLAHHLICSLSAL